MRTSVYTSISRRITKLYGITHAAAIFCRSRRVDYIIVTARRSYENTRDYILLLRTLTAKLVCLRSVCLLSGSPMRGRVACLSYNIISLCVRGRPTASLRSRFRAVFAWYLLTPHKAVLDASECRTNFSKPPLSPGGGGVQPVFQDTSH